MGAYRNPDEMARLIEAIREVYPKGGPDAVLAAFHDNKPLARSYVVTLAQRAGIKIGEEFLSALNKHRTAKARATAANRGMLDEKGLAAAIFNEATSARPCSKSRLYFSPCW